MARAYRLDTLFIATDDTRAVRAALSSARLNSSATRQDGDVRDGEGEPWSRVIMQDDCGSCAVRRPGTTNKPIDKKHVWMEHLLNQHKLGKTPLLEALVDIEAASRCSAFIGSFDAHMSGLMLVRMVRRMGVVPPSTRSSRRTRASRGSAFTPSRCVRLRSSHHSARA